MAISRNNYRNGMNFSPFDDLVAVRGELNRLFGDLGTGNLKQLFGNWAPALDLEESEHDVKIDIELPGVAREDIKVSVENGVLTVSGERKQGGDAKEAGRGERYFGRFSRTVTLPTPVDSNAAKAFYKDGVLTVTLPKAEEAKPKSITISD